MRIRGIWNRTGTWRPKWRKVEGRRGLVRVHPYPILRNVRLVEGNISKGVNVIEADYLGESAISIYHKLTDKGRKRLNNCTTVSRSLNGNKGRRFSSCKMMALVPLPYSRTPALVVRGVRWKRQTAEEVELTQITTRNLESLYGEWRSNQNIDASHTYTYRMDRDNQLFEEF